MPQAVRHKAKQDRASKKTPNRYKNTPENRPSSGAERHYREITLLAFLSVALYLFISLATYHPLDLGWGDGQSAANIQNVGGRWGAKFADSFFTWFGYFAYLFSFLVAYIGLSIYQSKHLDLLENPKQLIVPTLGFILTLSAGCGLAIVHFAAESVLLPSHAGGILGSWVGNGLKNVSNAFGATLFLLIVFFAGFSMMTKLSWLNIMDKLGETTLKWLPIIVHELYENWLPKLLYFSKVVLHWLGIHGKKTWQQAQSKSRELQSRWQQHKAGQVNEDADATAQHYLEPEPISTYPETAHKHEQASEIDNTHQHTEQLEHSIEQQLIERFDAYDVQAHIRYIQTGPTLLHIELQTDEGQAHKLLGMQQELAADLAMPHIRLYETAPEQIVLEIPNPDPEYIDLGELLQQKSYTDSHSPLMLALGKDISGHPVIIDLARIPHLLLGGQNRLDMDVMLDNMLLSLIRKNNPSQVRLLLLDSIAHGFDYYQDLPQLLSPIISADSPDKYHAFNWLVHDMERRYQLMNQAKVRNIDDYNQKMRKEKGDTLPYLVMMVHELETLWQATEAKAINDLMTDLARKARSAGIHMIIASAKPSASVITPTIKNNFPSKIAAQLPDKNSSQYFLGRTGAEYLLGDGDMFYLTPNTTGVPARLHAAQIQDDKADKILAYARALGQPQYQDLRKLSVTD